MFQHAVGQILASRGDVAEGETALRTASALFRQLPWRYPLVRFSVGDAMRYADAAMQRLPKRSLWDVHLGDE